MGNQLQARTWFTLSVALCQSFGCGNARPLVSSQSQVDQPTGLDERPLSLKLKIRIIGEARYSAERAREKVPPKVSLKHPTAFEKGVKYSKEVVSFPKVLDLPDPASADPDRRKELFFVWPDASLGQKLAHATATHRFLNGHNQWIKGTKPILITYDAVSQIWFIPISEVFRSCTSCESFQFTGAETQLISLHLKLADGSDVSIKIKFRVKGKVS
jgi:hypothetical protein